MGTAAHYTAWITTDRSALDGDCMDLEVVQDELLGDDPTDESARFRFYAVTSVDARDGDIDDAIREAEELLRDAGWRVVGEWNATPGAYTATVARV